MCHLDEVTLEESIDEVQQNVLGVLGMPLDPHNVLPVPEHLDSGPVRLGNHLRQWRQLPHLCSMYNTSQYR